MGLSIGVEVFRVRIRAGPFSCKCLDHCVGVGIMHVVVNTGLELEARGLPELTHVGRTVIVVQRKLREVSYEEKTRGVGLTSGIERTSKIALMSGVGLKV